MEELNPWNKKLTWNGLEECMIDFVKMLGEIGSLPYVSNQQRRVHNSHKRELQRNPTNLLLNEVHAIALNLTK